MGIRFVVFIMPKNSSNSWILLHQIKLTWHGSHVIRDFRYDLVLLGCQTVTPSPYLRNAELGAALELFKLAVLRDSYSNQCLVQFGK